jgi:hypothetical protein
MSLITVRETELPKLRSYVQIFTFYCSFLDPFFQIFVIYVLSRARTYLCMRVRVCVLYVFLRTYVCIYGCMYVFIYV